MTTDNSRQDHLLLIAGKGAYPLLLAESARHQGVKKISTIAFKHETSWRIGNYVDETHWLYIGQLQKFLDTVAQTGARCAVMAGQITPTNLFSLRMDKPMWQLLSRLRQRNAHTIFGAVADELKAIGVELLPAHLFMEKHLATPGTLGTTEPTPEQWEDIKFGFQVAQTTSSLEIGQTVVIKNGTILAVEAFEGTDATIRRAGKLGGPGAVIVKVAKVGHDMRFDIPVIGTKTLKNLAKIRAGALAMEAGRAIILEKDKVIAAANKHGISLVAVPQIIPGAKS